VGVGGWWRRGAAFNVRRVSDLYDVLAQYPRVLSGQRRAVLLRDVRTDGVRPGELRWAVHQGVVGHPFHGVYLLGRGQQDLLDQLKALLLLLPGEAAFGWHTGAALYGFGVATTDKVHVVVPAGSAVPQLRGVAVHQSVLAVEPVIVLGVPCLPAVRCAIDLTRGLRRMVALPVLDAALRAGACTSDELAIEVAQHDRLRGVRQARELVELADPRAECRQESQLRLVMHDGGLPPAVPQFPVCDEYGYLRYRLDLGLEHYLIGSEYDGQSHLDRERLRRDRQRHNWLEERGWAMRYFTSNDLYYHPHLIVDTIRRAIKGKSV